MNTIYMACFPYPVMDKTGVMSYALAEDGYGLCSHYSSHEYFAKHDIGFKSEWHHDVYKAHYPEGYNLEWVDDPENHDGWTVAVAKNREIKESSVA